MKTLLLNVLLFCFLTDTVGQVSGRLTGAAGQPIPFANVLLLKATDTSLVKAALTDEKGDYLIQHASPGKYFLRFSSVGYQSWDAPPFELTDSRRNKDFGTLVMQESSRELGEVVVRAEKPLFQQQVYGTVVNVESSVLTKGSSVLEVLERSPGIFIDRQRNDIALNGKGGVSVMVNGKPMRMSGDQLVSLLNGMSANDIEKIELLTTPPSRYDAEGSAGMINIVLKKSKKRGTEGSFSVTGGYGWGEKGAASVHIDHSTGKVNLYGSYSFNHDRAYSDWHSTGTNNMPLLGGQNYTDILSEIRSTDNSHNATLGFETKLSSTLTIGSNINYNNSRVTISTHNTAFYDVEPDSLYTLDANIYGDNRWQNLITSLYAVKNLGKGGQINVDIDYLYYKNSNPSDAHSSYHDINGNEAGSNDTLFSPWQKGFAHSSIKVGVGKIDFTRQLSPRLKLETGIKGTYTSNSGLSRIESLVDGTWVSRGETSTNIVMKESIGAAYASVNAQLAPAINLIAGVRYEYADTRMDDPGKKQPITHRKLGKLFPSVFFSWKLNENSDLQFSYTQRISRPSYNDLASFVVYTSPNSIESGNPLLKPTITNNLKAGYNYRGYIFSVLFSRDDHPIARYQVTKSPEGDLVNLSPQNLIYQHNLTFQTSLPWKVNDWWNMSYSFAGGWRQFKEDFTVTPAKKTYFGFSANFSESFKFPRNFSLEISGWYNGSSYNGTKKVDGFGALNAGIKKELKNNGGTFQLSVPDIFRTVSVTSYYGTLAEEAFDIKSHVVFRTESARSPVIKLTYSRSFGNSTIKSQRKQDAGSNEERERIKKG